MFPCAGALCKFLCTSSLCKFCLRVFALINHAGPRKGPRARPSFCTLTTQSPPEGRAQTAESSERSWFLHVAHANPRRGSRAKQKANTLVQITTPIPAEGRPVNRRKDQTSYRQIPAEGVIFGQRAVFSCEICSYKYARASLRVQVCLC